MVYQTVYHVYDKKFIFTTLITLVSNKAPRGFVVYCMANIPRLRAVSRHSTLRRTLEQPLTLVYWPYTALLLNYSKLWGIIITFQHNLNILSHDTSRSIIEWLTWHTPLLPCDIEEEDERRMYTIEANKQKRSRRDCNLTAGRGNQLSEERTHQFYVASCMVFI